LVAMAADGAAPCLVEIFKNLEEEDSVGKGFL
jgi:hypothetical protein